MRTGYEKMITDGLGMRTTGLRTMTKGLPPMMRDLPTTKTRLPMTGRVCRSLRSERTRPAIVVTGGACTKP